MSKKPLLIILRGIPGSGKTTISELIGFINIDPEKYINDEKSYEDNEIKKSIYRKCLADCYKNLRNDNNVVWNQSWRMLDGIYLTINNLNYYFKRDLGEDSYLKYIIINLNVSIESCWERIKLSGKFKNKEDYYNFCNLYEEIITDDKAIFKLESTQSTKKLKEDIACIIGKYDRSYQNNRRNQHNERRRKTPRTII